MNLGKNNKETRQPNPKGINISQLSCEIDSITISYTPRATRIALPDIPGIKKNENANNPHANKYNACGASESIASLVVKRNPITIPRNKKTSNKGFLITERKKFAT